MIFQGVEDIGGTLYHWSRKASLSKYISHWSSYDAHIILQSNHSLLALCGWRGCGAGKGVGSTFWLDRF
jgi:hypothetical protein